MIKILPNPFVEKFNAEENHINRFISTVKNLKPTKEDIKKIVLLWFDKEAKRGHFNLDELIDSFYELISK